MAEDKRIAKTKEAIQTALIELAKTTPLDKITITALSQEANISRKTFYDRYASVDNLIESIRKQLIVEFDSIFQPPLIIGDEINKGSVFQFLQFAKNHKELLGILNADDSTFLKEALDDRAEELQTYIVNNGNFDEHAAKIITPWILTFYVHGVEELTEDWLTSDNDLSEEEMATVMVTLFKAPVISYKTKANLNQKKDHAKTQYDVVPLLTLL